MLKTIKPINSALKIALIYAVFSLLWISSSDQILFFFVKNSELLTKIQTAKGWLFVLVTSLILYLLLYREIMKVKRATQSHLESEKKYRIVAELTGQMIYDFEVLTGAIQWSGSITEITGFTTSEFQDVGVTEWEKMIHPDDQGKTMALLSESQKDGDLFKVEYRFLHKNGQYIFVEDSGNFLKDPTGSVYRMLGSMKDISERKIMESKLRHSQKMEAIGTLAGGIAHDFNNILSAIIGYGELAKIECKQGSDLESYLEGLLTAGNRANSLVKQILAFSRQSESERYIIQPAKIVKEALHLLRSTLPATIQVVEDIKEDTQPVLADPTQLNQIVMNLSTNAFHAMENTGGVLKILLRQSSIDDENFLIDAGVTSGNYIDLTVSDTGPGIDQEVIERIFDPFFTTKEPGKGTGMGLSIVHGIVKSHEGHILVSSKKGQGTTIRALLPVVEQQVTPVNKEQSAAISGGDENILFVDDEISLLSLGREVLMRLGYSVTTALSGTEALRIFKEQPDYFDLIITDQTMPKMTGLDLAERILGIRSNIPIILCTGYSTIVTEEEAIGIGIKEFALKPLPSEDLARLVRNALNSG